MDRQSFSLHQKACQPFNTQRRPGCSSAGTVGVNNIDNIHNMFIPILLAASTAICATAAPTVQHYAKRSLPSGLEVKLSVADGILTTPTDGRIVLMFAPNGTDPLDDTDVTSSPNSIFGKNVYNFGSNDSIVFSGGSNSSTEVGVYGWPNVTLDDVLAGTYHVQAFLNRL
jgi:hypothetical protein